MPRHGEQRFQCNAPAIAEKFGILPGNVLNMNTVAGVVGVIFFIVVGQINRDRRPHHLRRVPNCRRPGLSRRRQCRQSCHVYRLHVYCGGRRHVCGLHLRRDLVTQWFPKKKASSWATPPWATIWPPSPLSPYHTSGRSAGHWQRCNSPSPFAPSCWASLVCFVRNTCRSAPQPGQCVR